MSDFWLRCDACNKILNEKVDSAMELIIRFKPSRVPRSLVQINPRIERHRCPSCGWVNCFAPVENADLTPNWRHDIVLKRA